MRVFVIPPADKEHEAAYARAIAATGHERLPAAASYHAGLTDSERAHFLDATDKLLEADMLVADTAADPGTAAWCAAWLLAKGRLVVLTIPRDRRGQTSPMLAGNPSPWQRIVTYDSAADLEEGLRQALDS